MSNGTQPSPALTQYGQILTYLAYENTAYWQRNNFFLAGSAALLALSASNFLPLPNDKGSLEKCIVFAVIAGVGIALTVAWKKVLGASEYWLDKWHDHLRELEPAAYSTVNIFRATNADGDRTRVRTIAHGTMWVFMTVWIVALGYGFVKSLICGFHFLK
jgi:hypothetical protein